MKLDKGNCCLSLKVLWRLKFISTQVSLYTPWLNQARLSMLRDTPLLEKNIYLIFFSSNGVINKGRNFQPDDG